MKSSGFIIDFYDENKSFSLNLFEKQRLNMQLSKIMLNVSVYLEYTRICQNKMILLC